MPDVQPSASNGAAIEIRLGKLQQLFNSFDPSPFHEKELDQDAEDYIVGSVDEFPLLQKLKLVIHLPPDQIALTNAKGLEAATRNHFAYRVAASDRMLRFRLREGRTALAIGIVFLFACMSIRQIATALAPGAISEIFSEGLLILGWVAMWRPLQIFLYDWWPIRHHARLYAKLARMPVEIRQSDSPA
jgi:hypothetical protein